MKVQPESLDTLEDSKVEIEQVDSFDAWAVVTDEEFERLVESIK